MSEEFVTTARLSARAHTKRSRSRNKSDTDSAETWRNWDSALHVA